MIKKKIKIKTDINIYYNNDWKKKNDFCKLNMQLKS